MNPPSHLDPAPPPLTALRPILVVDDSADDRELVLDRLARAQVPNPVVACCHGTEAVVRLSESWRTVNMAEWPCLILLDLRMPCMSGIEVLEWLRAQPERHGLKVVIVSHSAKPGDYALAKSLGAHGFLIKYPCAECLASIVQLAASDSGPAAADAPGLWS